MLVTEGPSSLASSYNTQTVDFEGFLMEFYSFTNLNFGEREHFRIRLVVFNVNHAGVHCEVTFRKRQTASTTHLIRQSPEVTYKLFSNYILIIFQDCFDIRAYKVIS